MILFINSGEYIMKNKIKYLLCKLGICNEDSIVPFYPKLRDRDDVAVLKCNKSGDLLPKN